MTQELLDLRASILEGRLVDALEIVDELEGMSKQAILRNIESFLSRLLVHLIKNQVEKRLTNSWVASISDSIRQIQKLNLKDNKTSHYVKPDDWESMLEDEFDGAVDAASIEVRNGLYNPFQLAEIIDRPQVILTAKNLLLLTYSHAARSLPFAIKENLVQLSGGEEWKRGSH